MHTLAGLAMYSPPKLSWVEETLINAYLDPSSADTGESAPVPGTAEAIELWRKNYGNPYNRPKDDDGNYLVESDAEIAERFRLLVELVGPAPASTLVKNSDGRLVSMEPERVKAYYDAWVERAGSREDALDLLCKNPNLVAGDLNEIKNAPVAVAQAVAGLIDLTRKFSG